MSYMVAMNRSVDRLDARLGHCWCVNSFSDDPDDDPGEWTRSPLPPRGWSGSSPLAYVDTESRQAYATAVVGWAPVATNVDGTAATDISGYRVQYAYIGLTQVGGDPLNDPFC